MAMTAVRAAVLESLADLIIAVERPHPVRVGIDGCSAAGKTTLADELAPVVARHGRSTLRVSLDDFKTPHTARTRYPRDSAESYYFEMYDYPAIRADLLAPLGPGGDRRFRAAIFDQQAQRSIDDPPTVAADDAVVVVDGGFLYRPELDDLWDFRIYLHIDFDLVLTRGSQRDQAWMVSLEAAQARYRTRYIPGERRYLDTVDPRRRADVVVDNHDPTQPHLQLPAEHSRPAQPH